MRTQTQLLAAALVAVAAYAIVITDPPPGPGEGPKVVAVNGLPWSALDRGSAAAASARSLGSR